MEIPETPHIDLAYKLVHIFGIPTLLVALAWLIRTWDRTTQKLDNIDDGTKKANDQVAVVKMQVDTIQSNHLQHLAEGIKELGNKTDKGNDILISIDKGIGILTDRKNREKE